MSLALLSVVGAIGRAGLRKEVGLLRPGPRRSFCLLSVPLGEQASGRRWDCSGLGHVGVFVCCRCHWESRPQEGGGIAQAWAMSEFLSST